MTQNIDTTEVVLLAKKLCFEIEMVLAKQNYDITAEEEWNQKGPRLFVRFLTEQVSQEDFEVRKTTLIQNVERLKVWLQQSAEEYQRRWPSHVNERGGSVPAFRANMFKSSDNFIALCKKDVHEIAVLHDLSMLSPEQGQSIVAQPLQSVVYDETKPEDVVVVEKNRNAYFEKMKEQQTPTAPKYGGGGMIKS